MRLEALEKQKKQALIELEVAKKEKMKEVDAKKAVMNKEWQSFCQTLKVKHWKKAQQIWSKLDDLGFKQPPLKANTKELFKNNFNFDTIATNDDTVAILQDLDIAENNLNQNPDNKILVNKFIMAAQ